VSAPASAHEIELFARVPVEPFNGPSSATIVVGLVTFKRPQVKPVPRIVIGGFVVFVQTIPSCQVTVPVPNVALSLAYRLSVAWVLLVNEPSENVPRLSTITTFDLPF